MKSTVHKWFWAWDFDREEHWLNEMAAKGLQLTGIGYCKYIFEEGTPGEYTVRLELLNNVPSHPESRQYIKFIEETGAEHVGSFLRWVYFRKKATGEGFDLFSDIDSRIRHLDRLLAFLGVLSLCDIYLGITNMLIPLWNARFTFNLAAGLLCLLMGFLLGYGFIRILMKKQQLKKERALHE